MCVFVSKGVEDLMSACTRSEFLFLTIYYQIDQEEAENDWFSSTKDWDPFSYNSNVHFNRTTKKLDVVNKLD
jgi:hypothetical protein